MTEVIRHGHVMPTWSPPYAPGPYYMEKYHCVMVELEIPRSEIEFMTPEPLQPAEHNKVLAVIVDATQLPHSLHYHEAFICHEVEFKGKRGLHIPYIWVSTDTALLVGREIYGMPKLMCDDGRLQLYANEAYGKLERNGITMMELAVTVDQKAAPSDLPALNRWMMLRQIPSPDPKFPARRQVVYSETTGAEIKFAWKGRGWARMGYPSSSRIDRIPTTHVTGGWHCDFKFVLGDGQILDEHEYHFQGWK